ncbi:MAG: hypothetical protein K8R23_08105 [Chthoniobacter sp.]|nr:hypothetical protein [Chthoniobacter sp.]
MKVLILGAGASKAYPASKSGLRMPIARDFLETFGKSSLAHEPWVLTGNILTYARDHFGIAVEDLFTSDLDIEAFHSDIEAKLLAALDRLRLDKDERLKALTLRASYVQLVFVFAATINLIQNGPVSVPHRHLAAHLQPDDVVITFNWDTLMDRALAESTDWRPDFGYGFAPHRIYRNGWEEPDGTANDSAVRILKLHGSSNWLTGYPVIDYETCALGLMQTAPADRVSVFECTLDPYATYGGRWMSGYERYSFGYYPPNLPDDSGNPASPGHQFFRARYKFPWMPPAKSSEEGLVSSPLIIPPVKRKAYGLFGSLFDRLWQQAGRALTAADEIALVGYSFPPTDSHSLNLFKTAFCGRNTLPRITIVDPSPQRAHDVLHRDCGIPDSHIHVFGGSDGYFSEAFDTNKLWR